MASKNRAKKSPLVVVEFIIIGILIAAIAFMLVLYFSFRSSGTAPKIFGYYIYHTHAVNMAPKIPAETAVFAEEKEKENVHPGSVVLCNIDSTTTLIRIVETLEEPEGTFYIVRFDTSPQNETYKIPKESVIAKATMHDERVGKLLNFATSKTGIILVVIIPSILIVLFQIIRIVVTKPENADYSPEDDDDDFGEPVKPSDPRSDFAPVRAKFDLNKTAPEESFLSVDKSGKAEYSPKVNPENMLITGEVLDAMSGRKPVHDQPFLSGYSNEPVRIPEEKPEEPAAADSIRSIIGADIGDTSGFAPKVSNVLPESLSQLKTAAYPDGEPIDDDKPVKPSGHEPEEVIIEEEPPEVFYTEEEPAVIAPTEADQPIISTNSIPENAVVPRETIAPRRKRNTGKTIDELMSIIDAEQAKIKKHK